MKFFSHLVVLFFFKFTFGFDNERSMSTPEMIEYFKYPVETHVVETEDGYLLDMHRIPYGRDLRTIPKCTEKRPVALLMHALISTDAQFLLNLPSESQAFMMADAGFDVWMPNVRGNRYGRRHKTLQIIDMRFWNFTWYEHAHYDLTSSVDYILNATGHESLYYIGHSQGATILFAKLAESSPEWQSKIKKFYAMAPSCGFSHALLPMNIFGMTVIQDLAALVLDGKFGHFPIGLPNVVMDAVAKICGTTLSAFACTLVYEAVDFKRESLDQFNQTRLSTYLGHVPSTTSTLNILHWAQMLKYHDLRKLDLGVKRNFAMYGAPTAPVFDLSQIVAPTVVYFSGDDHISDSADVREHLLTRMGTALERYVDLDHFTHFDYVIGLRAAEEVFKPIIMDIYDDLEKNGC